MSGASAFGPGSPTLFSLTFTKDLKMVLRSQTNCISQEEVLEDIMCLTHRIFGTIPFSVPLTELLELVEDIDGVDAEYKFEGVLDVLTPEFNCMQEGMNLNTTQIGDLLNESSAAVEKIHDLTSVSGNETLFSFSGAGYGTVPAGATFVNATNAGIDPVQFAGKTLAAGLSIRITSPSPSMPLPAIPYDANGEFLYISIQAQYSTPFADNIETPDFDGSEPCTISGGYLNGYFPVKWKQDALASVPPRLDGAVAPDLLARSGASVDNYGLKLEYDGSAGYVPAEHGSSGPFYGAEGNFMVSMQFYMPELPYLKNTILMSWGAFTIEMKSVLGGGFDLGLAMSFKDINGETAKGFENYESDCGAVVTDDPTFTDRLHTLTVGRELSPGTQFKVWLDGVPLTFAESTSVGGSVDFSIDDAPPSLAFPAGVNPNKYENQILFGTSYKFNLDPEAADVEDLASVDGWIDNLAIWSTYSGSFDAEVPNLSTPNEAVPGGRPYKVGPRPDLIATSAYIERREGTK